MHKLRVAIIGLGHQSTSDHIPQVESSPSLKIVSVCDTDPTRVKKFLQTHQNIEGFTNLKDLLARSRFDFAIVATPHATHNSIAKMLLSHRIPVLKEKPLSISFRSARSLVAFAKNSQVQLSIALQRRSNPAYNSFFKLIKRIGRPFYIDIRYTFYTPIPHEGWRGVRAHAGGGCLIDMGYHMVDLLMWYFGLPDQVLAEISSEAKEGIVYDAEDTAHAMFRYRNKKLWGTLLVSRVIPPKHEYFDIYGTRGILHLEKEKIELRSSNGDVLRVIKNSKKSASGENQIGKFAKSLQNKRAKMNFMESHLAHMAFIEAAYHSVRTRRYVDPHKFH